MTRKQVHLAYVFAFIASASITTQMLSSVPGSELLGTLLPGVKVMDRAQSIELDRQRKAVMEHCQKLTALDPSARCPDINEEWKFDQFLPPELKLVSLRCRALAAAAAIRCNNAAPRINNSVRRNNKMALGPWAAPCKTLTLSPISFPKA
jgi:hypothetical protein